MFVVDSQADTPKTPTPDECFFFGHSAARKETAKSRPQIHITTDRPGPRRWFDFFDFDTALCLHGMAARTNARLPYAFLVLAGHYRDTQSPW